MIDFDVLANNIVCGDSPRTIEFIHQALFAKIPAQEILDNGLLPATGRLGSSFEKGEIFLPELLMAGDAMKAAIELLRPELAKRGASYAGKYAIGTVQGDLHDIGKNIVILMLEGNGWDVTDLGIDVPPEQFCGIIKKGNFDILGMSLYSPLPCP